MGRTLLWEQMFHVSNRNAAVLGALQTWFESDDNDGPSPRKFRNLYSSARACWKSTGNTEGGRWACREGTLSKFAARAHGGSVLGLEPLIPLSPKKQQTFQRPLFTKPYLLGPTGLRWQGWKLA